MTGIGNRHDGSEGSRAMRASHFVGASDPIVIGGETIFRTGRNGISKQKYKKKCGELHDQKLARRNSETNFNWKKGSYRRRGKMAPSGTSSTGSRIGVCAVIPRCSPA